VIPITDKGGILKETRYNNLAIIIFQLGDFKDEKLMENSRFISFSFNLFMFAALFIALLKILMHLNNKSCK
jgi:hypothetical protein